jgi:hypothetical protein
MLPALLVIAPTTASATTPMAPANRSPTVKAHHRVLTSWKHTPAREGMGVAQFCVQTK